MYSLSLIRIQHEYLQGTAKALCPIAKTCHGRHRGQTPSAHCSKSANWRDKQSEGLQLTAKTNHGRQRLVHKCCQGIRSATQDWRSLLEGLLHSCLLLQGYQASMSQSHYSVDSVPCTHNSDGVQQTGREKLCLCWVVSLTCSACGGKIDRDNQCKACSISNKNRN